MFAFKTIPAARSGLTLAAVLTALSAGTALAQNAAFDPEIEIPPAPYSEEIAGRLSDEIRSKPALVSVMTTMNVPLHYFDEDGTTLIGFDVDFSYALGEVLGMDIEIAGADIQQLIPGLQAGRYDMAVTVLVPTAERRALFDFVDYLSINTALVVREEHADEISIEDNSICGHSVAVVTGSIQALNELPAVAARCEEEGLPPPIEQSYADLQNASLALMSQRVDSVLYTAPAVDAMIRAADGLAFAGLVPTPPGAIAVQKGSLLLEPLRDAILVLMESGVYDAIVSKWGMETGRVSDPVINNDSAGI